MYKVLNLLSMTWYDTSWRRYFTIISDPLGSNITASHRGIFRNTTCFPNTVIVHFLFFSYPPTTVDIIDRIFLDLLPLIHPVRSRESGVLRCYSSVNSSGVRSRREECGLKELYSRRQASIFLRASSSDRNQCRFKHSSRKEPLIDSMYGLSVGLPGLEKSNVTPFS